MDDLMSTYTPEHLQALREALASGEHRVTYEGKSIEYRSVADLKAAIAEVMQEWRTGGGVVRAKITTEGGAAFGHGRVILGPIRSRSRGLSPQASAQANPASAPPACASGATAMSQPWE